MGVKRGYKQTEVGMIPVDWEVSSTNQIGTPVRGGSPRPAGDPRYFNGSYIPWLTVAALTNIPASQLVVTETATCLTEEGSFYSRTLSPGTLIIANSGATLGVAKILGIRSCANDGIAAILNLSKTTSPHYLAHFINTRTDYLRDIVATGNGQPNLNTELIGNFKIPLPPTKAEQEAIAEALSDADALIESLEQLVAKKRQIKHGAMQELLTGKRRLPGFAKGSVHKQADVGIIPVDWKVVPIMALLERGTSITYGVVQPGRNDEKGVLFIRGGDILAGKILTSQLRTITKAVSAQFSRTRLAGGEIVISLVGYPGEVALVPKWLEGANIARQVALVKLGSCQPISTEYVCKYLQSSIGRRLLLNEAIGSAQQVINLKDINKVLVVVPATKAEQEAIVANLSDMDAEITALEAKLAKARQIKQGMMQALLTGRIRLV